MFVNKCFYILQEFLLNSSKHFITGFAVVFSRRLTMFIRFSKDKIQQYVDPHNYFPQASPVTLVWEKKT